MSRSGLRIALVLALSGALIPGSALAADISVGARIASIVATTFGPVMVMITLGCTLLGLFLFYTGLSRLVEMSNGQTGGKSGASVMLTFAAAACLIALPEAAGIGMTSMVGNSSFFGASDLSQIATEIDDPSGGAAQSGAVTSRVTSLMSFAAPENCMSQRDAVPCMAGNLAKNVVPVGVFGAFVFAFLCGLWIFASCLMSLSKGASSGQGMPPGLATKFVASIFLLNAPILFGIVSNTVFGYGEMTINDLDATLNSSSQMLSYSTGTGSAALKKYEELIGYVFFILVFFGVIAFIRGILIVMAAGEGRREAGYGQGAVYVIAGILMANSKLTTCYIMSTAGMATAGGIGFCS